MRCCPCRAAHAPAMLKSSSVARRLWIDLDQRNTLDDDSMRSLKLSDTCSAASTWLLSACVGVGVGVADEGGRRDCGRRQ